jgi:TolB-like protein
MPARLRLFCALLLLAAAGRAAGAAALPTMAVLDFRTVGDAADAGEGAAEILRTTLAEAGLYKVLERSMLKEALKEQRLAYSGVLDQARAAGIGKMLGAQVVAVGSVVKLGGTYTLNVRFIEAETGAVLLGRTLTAGAREDIPGLCRQMVRLLASGGSGLEYSPEPAGHWAIGGIVSGAVLKYQSAGGNGWELRAQRGQGVLALGARYCRYGPERGGPRLFWGLEADQLSFESAVGEGNGYAGGFLAGGELRLTRQLTLEADFGALYLHLADGRRRQTLSDLAYVVNFGIYWHFR